MNRLITLLFHDVYRRASSESGFNGAAADRYKLSIENFKAQLGSVLETRKDKPILLNSHGANQGNATPFAISVDDGGLSYHSIIAPELARLGWFGHCLITTGKIGQPGFLHKQHIRELHEAGHLIGSHSVSHPALFSDCSSEELATEWSQSKQTLEDIIGERVTLGSVPGGFYSRNVAHAASAAGLEALMTSEPVTRVHSVDGCRIVGRFTLRRHSPTNLAGELVCRERNSRNQQWLAWNTKKLLKKTLGTGYASISSLLPR